MNEKLTGKDIIISTLEIAEINFLMSLKGVNFDLVSKQFNNEINHLAWIVGHCVSHMDSYLSIYTEKRRLSKVERDYHAYGASKEDIKIYNFSFRELLDNFLQISEEFFKKLHALDEEQFFNKPFPDAREKLYQFIQRITLHIMGHTGQIVLIRRLLGNPSWSFVVGVSSEDKDKLKQEWLEWWEENKEKYS